MLVTKIINLVIGDKISDLSINSLVSCPMNSHQTIKVSGVTSPGMMERQRRVSKEEPIGPVSPVARSRAAASAAFAAAFDDVTESPPPPPLALTSRMGELVRPKPRTGLFEPAVGGVRHA